MLIVYAMKAQEICIDEDGEDKLEKKNPKVKRCVLI
jgi:hypothetical protein